MISFLDLIRQFNEWSGIQLNANKCKIIAFLQDIQSISRKRDRDDALKAILAHVTLAGRPIGSLSEDEPLLGAYLGTSLTTSLCPDVKRVTAEDWHGSSKDPLPPHIKQRLLIYGAHSKIAHTHCLMALSPDAIKAIDSLLERLSRRIWGLPHSFPRAGLHGPVN